VYLVYARTINNEPRITGHESRLVIRDSGFTLRIEGLGGWGLSGSVFIVGTRKKIVVSQKR
jgi:hypothetical protein